MIQWYPGHMAKALREMEEKIKLVDMVMILLDARIPASSVNPKLVEMFKNKPVLYLLNKTDKADPVMNNKWMNLLSSDNKMCVSIDARNKRSIKDITSKVEMMMEAKRAKDAARGLKKRPIKTMIVGIPNVGKSTLINTLCGKKVAVVGDRPGVTKNEQWTRVNDSFDLLDTPGVLWPKFDDEMIGYKLLITGAIKDEITKHDEAAKFLIGLMKEHYAENFIGRYKISFEEENSETLIMLGKSQNFILSDSSVDLDRTSLFLLQEFRSGALGRITLDLL